MKGNRFDWDRALSIGVQLPYSPDTSSYSVGKYINGLCLCDCFTNNNNCGGGFWNGFGGSALPQQGYSRPDEVTTSIITGNQGCICKCRTRRRGYQGSNYGVNQPSPYWPAFG